MRVFAAVCLLLVSSSQCARSQSIRSADEIKDRIVRLDERMDALRASVDQMRQEQSKTSDLVNTLRAEAGEQKAMLKGIFALLTFLSVSVFSGIVAIVGPWIKKQIVPGEADAELKTGRVSIKSIAGETSWAKRETRGQSTYHQALISVIARLPEDLRSTQEAQSALVRAGLSMMDDREAHELLTKFASLLREHPKTERSKTE